MTKYYKKTGEITTKSTIETRHILKNYFPIYDHKGKYVGEIIDGKFSPKSE